MTSFIRGFIVATLLLVIGVSSAALITTNKNINQSAQAVQQFNQTAYESNAQTLAASLNTLAERL